MQALGIITGYTTQRGCEAQLRCRSNEVAAFNATTLMLLYAENDASQLGVSEANSQASCNRRCAKQ